MSWEAVGAAVAEARALVAAAAPDAGTAAEGEAYVSRVLTAMLGPAFMGHALRADGLSSPLPCHGGPNPDYIMRHAQVDPAGRYRLQGAIEGSERIGVGFYAPAPSGPPKMLAYRAFDSDFALDIGPDAFAIPEGARVMLIRTLHRDATRPPARLRFTGGAPAVGLALAGGSNDAALAFAARGLVAAVRDYLKWTEAVAATPNHIAPAPPHLAEQVQGDPDTLYFLGSFALTEGEWLEIAFDRAPTGYWSLHVYDYWFQHLQVPGVHDRDVAADPDGAIRIAIGPSLPAGPPNRVDTLGRRRGNLILRIIGAGDCPTATVQRSFPPSPRT